MGTRLAHGLGIALAGVALALVGAGRPALAQQWAHEVWLPEPVVQRWATTGPRGTLVAYEPRDGSSRWFVLGLSPEGDLATALQLDVGPRPRQAGLSAAPDGGFLAWGTTEVPAERTFVARLDADGTVRWQFAFDAEAVGFATPSSATWTAGGAWILVGTRSPWPGWIVRLGDDGVVEWRCRSPGPSATWPPSLTATWPSRATSGSHASDPPRSCGG
jgi:hypothetical protein